MLLKIEAGNGKRHKIFPFFDTYTHSGAMCSFINRMNGNGNVETT